MQGSDPDHSGPADSPAASAIAQQSDRSYTQLPAAIHSCNRLGRVGSLPFRTVIFGGLFRLRTNKDS